MSEKIYVGESKHGKGIFAKRDIKKLEHILTFSGKIISFQEARNPSIERYVIQIGKDKYLAFHGEADDFINHSCDPNAGLKDNVNLIAIKNIGVNEEIVFDYSTCMDEDCSTMKFNCGSKNCRGIIKDFKYLPFEVRGKYVELGIVPEWIIEGLRSYSR